MISVSKALGLKTISEEVVDLDPHGRGKIVRNILTNWAAMVVQMASGFIVPRLIDRNLSQEALGLWDLAWSFVVYFALIQMGVTSSVNRYVAFHRTKGDLDRVNKVVTSAAFIMRGMAGAILVAAALCVWGIGTAFHANLGSYVPTVRWLVFLLGINVAVQISATVYASVLTGCHRWDLHNGIQALTSALTVSGMIIALLTGYGLVTLAVVHLVGETVGRSARAVAAYRICPWLEIRSRHFTWEEARAMLAFGGKASVAHVSQMILNSTVSVMIAGYLGPAALAFYSRPLSLMRNVSVLINKYAMVFSPTISSLQAADEHATICDLTLKATRVGLYIVLPGFVFLTVFGAEVLRVWMGPQYADPILMSLVVLAFLFQVSHIPVLKTLVGLNMHGQPGLVIATTSAVTIGTVYALLKFGGRGLHEVAAAVAVMMTLAHGVYLPVYACRRLGLSLRVFWQRVWRGPVVSAIPFAVCLLVARASLAESAGLAALVGGATGSCVLALYYWKFVVPLHWKQRLLSRCSLVWKPKPVL